MTSLDHQLRTLASEALRSSAGTAARAAVVYLLPIARRVSEEHGALVMQAAAYALACQRAFMLARWTNEAERCMVEAAQGMLVAGYAPEIVRAALSFWAVETDPAVWRMVAET